MLTSVCTVAPITASIIIVSQDSTYAAGGGSAATVPAPDWFADWGTSTGTLQNATWDGTNPWKFNSESGLDPVIQVVAAPAGFPSTLTNVLRIDGHISPDQSNYSTHKVEVDGSSTGTKWPDTAVGNYLFMRYYFKMSLPDNFVSGNPHYTENVPGQITWFEKQIDPSAGSYNMQCGHDAPSPPQYYQFTSNFTTNNVYRIERRLFKKSANTFNYSIRVYDGDSGVTFQDDNTTSNVVPGNGHTLAADVAGGSGDWNMVSTTSTFGSVDVGQPGQSLSTWTSGSFVYIGAYAVWANRTDPNFWGASGSTKLIYQGPGKG